MNLYSLDEVERVRRWLDAEEKRIKDTNLTHKDLYLYVGGFVYQLSLTFRQGRLQGWSLWRARQGGEMEVLGDYDVGLPDIPDSVEEWIKTTEKLMDGGAFVTATEQAFFDDQLAEFDFFLSPYSPEQERAENSFVLHYKGCEIYWVIPNGGIIAALIIVDEKVVYQFSVGDKEARFYFGYNDDKGILQHCKNAIDRIH